MERVVIGGHLVRYILVVEQPTDLLTKGLLTARHLFLHSKLIHPTGPSLRPPGAEGVNQESKTV